MLVGVAGGARIDGHRPVQERARSGARSAAVHRSRRGASDVDGAVREPGRSRPPHRRLVRAVRVRGFRPGTNLHTYRTYAYIVGMLLVRSYCRADRVHRAMLCRGFRNKFHCLQEFKAGRNEWLFGAAMGGALLVLMYLEYR